ncbi:MAG: hypothetical protein QME75_03570 [Deltaproteobacteria bacterium]|nr:hypothetical protein [Deltaproteobacteria bacterium]
MGRFNRLVFGGTLIFVFFLPASAQAAFSLFEWATEGSYVHQIAHLLFLGAILFFIKEMYRGELHETGGFRSLIWACWLLAVWNLDAVIGHSIDWALSNPIIMGEGMSRRLVMENTRTWLFYIHRLNHFLLLPPAFYLFYRGLLALSRESEYRRS